jgi:predicted Abi (CAAX) family protease
MQMTSLVRTALAATLLVGIAAPAYAISSISAFETSVVSAKTGQQVQFKLNGEFDNSPCGLIINFSDGGKTQDIRVRDKEKFPLVVPRTFTKAGTYKVVAEGGRVGSALGCVGRAEATVTVTDPAPVAAAAPAPATAAAAPACPANYALVAASVKKTGEFTCAPKKPDTKITCAAGLRYFEQGGNVGCRK